MILPNFRSLASLGYPTHCVDIYGNVFDIYHQKYETHIFKCNNEDYIRLTVYSACTKAPIAHLVAEAWYLENRDYWKKSPYKDRIDRYLDFFLMPMMVRRSVGYIGNSKYQYWATRYGEIYEDRYRTVLPTRVSDSGYVTVSIHSEKVALHTIIARAFCNVPKYLSDLGFTKDTLVINHIDGNKLNNNASNLEWVTQIENQKHAFKNDLMRRSIPDATLKQIGDDLAAGMTDAAIGRKYNFNPAIINMIRNRKSPRYARMPQQWKSSYCRKDATAAIQVVELFLSGEKLSKIAKIMSLNFHTVDTIVHHKSYKKETEKYIPALLIEHKKRGWVIPKNLQPYADKLKDMLNKVEPVSKITDRNIQNLRFNWHQKLLKATTNNN